MAKAKYGSLNKFKELGLTDKNALKVVIFMTSSTGDGEFPENGLKFQKYLRLENDTRAMSHVSFTILGLGDSNYSKF
jgi:sulfite reductase alpha subunit-like flavoprotein